MSPFFCSVAASRETNIMSTATRKRQAAVEQLNARALALISEGSYLEGYHCLQSAKNQARPHTRTLATRTRTH